MALLAGVVVGFVLIAFGFMFFATLIGMWPVFLVLALWLVVREYRLSREALWEEQDQCNEDQGVLY